MEFDEISKEAKGIAYVVGMIRLRSRAGRFSLRCYFESSLSVVAFQTTANHRASFVVVYGFPSAVLYPLPLRKKEIERAETKVLGPS